MTRTLIPMEQDTLWDLPAPPAVPAQAAPAPAKKTRRFHVIDLPAPDHTPCRPRCLTCGHDEGDGPCTPCAIACRQPLARTRIEVCLTTTRITAHPAQEATS